MLLAVPLLIGAIVVVGWSLFGPWLIILPFASESTLVRNGVAAIMVCGRQSDVETEYEALDYAPRPNTGVWHRARKGECTVWFHLQSGE
jgi:hypothetical protein